MKRLVLLFAVAAHGDPAGAPLIQPAAIVLDGFEET